MCDLVVIASICRPDISINPTIICRVKARLSCLKCHGTCKAGQIGTLAYSNLAGLSSSHARVQGLALFFCKALCLRVRILEALEDMLLSNAAREKMRPPCGMRKTGFRPPSERACS